MAAVSNSDKITGGIGIAAVVVFVLTMLIAIVTKDDFTVGSGNISDLFTETVLIAGCVIAGALAAAFGLLISFWKVESKVFIGKVRGILIILSGIALVLLGVMKGDEYAIYLFMALIILAAASDVFYNWVADQKIIMVISLLLTLCILLTGILALTNDNNALGFMFVLFAAIWLCLIAAIRFTPIAETEQKEKKGKAKDSEAKKKNAPAPRPYPGKKEEPKPAKDAQKVRTTPKKEAPKPAPKKEEPKPAPKKEAPKSAPKKEEPKPEPKPIKVMSSREAAAARENARKKEEEPEPVVVAEPVPVPEPKPEPIPEPEPVIVAEPEFEPEPADIEADADGEEEYDESLEIMEDTPDALLRRATWNKGLRCRRDYGEFQIPIAYVKAKVAVYVRPEAGADDAAVDEGLRANGWTVFRYLESDITDGRDQAEEINKAVKENLRAERASKKKKNSKK
ncbi:MAG: hypothetical protein LBG63_01720 [Candidatus Methanoplasma sp.]|jgi:colicin import membrane protein|nr:hypothetical protein [Candidatus Methanoplasma sp.]